MLLIIIICIYCSNIVPFLKRFGLNPVTGEVKETCFLLMIVSSVYMENLILPSADIKSAHV